MTVLYVSIFAHVQLNVKEERFELFVRSRRDGRTRWVRYNSKRFLGEGLYQLAFRIGTPAAASSAVFLSSCKCVMNCDAPRFESSSNLHFITASHSICR